MHHSKYDSDRRYLPRVVLGGSILEIEEYYITCTFGLYKYKGKNNIKMIQIAT